MTDEATDRALDSQHVKDILAQFTQQRAARLMSEVRERFEQERAELRNEIAVLQQRVGDLEKENASLKQLLEEIEAELSGTDGTLKPIAKPAPAPAARPAAASPPPRPAPPPAPVTRAAPPAARPEPPPAPVPAYSVEEEGERRQSMRRKGNPVPIVLGGPGWDDAVEGWVLDRSSGGLGLRLDQKLVVGTKMKVRSARAPTAPWIDVEIRYCNVEGNNFRVGCQFQRELSWPEQQQFG